MIVAVFFISNHSLSENFFYEAKHSLNTNLTIDNQIYLNRLL